MSNNRIARGPGRCKGFNRFYSDPDGFVHLELTQGKETVIDRNDLPKVMGYRWHAKRHRMTYYAATDIYRDGKKTTIDMQTLLVQAIAGRQVDHRDGNGLNNKQYNLRSVTPRQNCQNLHIRKTSRFPGIYWNKLCEKWQAYVTVNRRAIYLGLFAAEKTAAEAYRSACKAIDNGTFAHVPRYRSRKS